MKKGSQQFIEAIIFLIDANKSREEGYDCAAEEIKGSTMKHLFSGLAETSRECHVELKAELRRLGGLPNSESTGNMYLPWQDIKTMDINRHRKLVFTSSEYCDYIIKKAYEEALKKADHALLSDKNIIQKQYLMIKNDMTKISNLKKAFIS